LPNTRLTLGKKCQAERFHHKARIGVVSSGYSAQCDKVLVKINSREIFRIKKGTSFLRGCSEKRL